MVREGNAPRNPPFSCNPPPPSSLAKKAYPQSTTKRIVIPLFLINQTAGERSFSSLVPLSGEGKLYTRDSARGSATKAILFFCLTGICLVPGFHEGFFMRRTNPVSDTNRCTRLSWFWAQNTPNHSHDASRKNGQEKKKKRTQTC